MKTKRRTKYQVGVADNIHDLLGHGTEYLIRSLVSNGVPYEVVLAVFENGNLRQAPSVPNPEEPTVLPIIPITRLKGDSQ